MTDMQSSIKIAIVDDQHLFRNILATTLGMDARMNIIQESENGNIFLRYLATGTLLPDIAIIDMSMPEMNGIELTQILQQNYPEIKVIILSVNYRDRLIAKTIDSGASAYLNKNCDLSTLKLAIESVYNTGFYIDSPTLRAIRDMSGKIDRKKDIETTDLTKREKEVLVMICQEFANTEIADKLFLSVRTVEGHRNNLLLKTGCKNTAGLVVYAVKNGLFEVLT